MKAFQGKAVALTITALVVFLTLLYASLRIPSTEGFNPSDDGVILAQSYRIAHGEVPHRDFISIRPVGSAVMHLVDFLSPLPLELSGRWFTWAEYLASSILIVLLLTGSWFRGLRRIWFLVLTAGSVLVIFIMNQNHYNLFPWTTIDSLFWFSLALYAWFRLKKVPAGQHAGWQVLLVFASSMAALCRQTFALPAFLLVGRMIWWELGTGQKPWPRALAKMLPAVLLGLLPAWLYAGMLTITGSWPEFIRQMTGRTELWQTGFSTFSHAFWQMPLPLFFLASVAGGLIRTWRSEAGMDVQDAGLFILLLKWLSFLFKILMVFMAFIRPEWLFAIALTFFWTLVLDLFLAYLHDGHLARWTWPAFWVLLAAWTSSISLGDNAPVFALGWLAGTAFLLQIRDLYNRFYRRVRRYQLVIPGLLIPALLVLSLVVQRKVNYRDVPAGQLTRRGGEIFSGLKGIDLSPGMADYLAEIKRLYQENGSPAGRFAVWPNNPLIYSLLNSPNPFPLDWMQAAEYAGSETRLEQAVAGIIRDKDPLILLEKTNMKRFVSGGGPVVADSADYRYLRILDSLARPLPQESQWFRLYRRK